MKKISAVLMLFFVTAIKAQSQISSSPFLNNTAFKAGYFGNLFSENGLNIGAEHLWKEKQKTKEKKKGNKTSTRQLLFNGDLGYSTNFTTKANNGLHTHFGLIWRKTNAKRWQRNLELNPLGYYRSFLPETFEVKEGEVSKIGLAGRNYFQPSIAYGIGRHRKGNELSGWHLNLNLAFRIPHNAGFLPYISLQFGYRYNFKKK